MGMGPTVDIFFGVLWDEEEDEWDDDVDALLEELREGEYGDYSELLGKWGLTTGVAGHIDGSKYTWLGDKASYVYSYEYVKKLDGPPQIGTNTDVASAEERIKGFLSEVAVPLPESGISWYSTVFWG